MRAPIEPLLFPGQGSENNRRRTWPRRRQHPGRFKHAGQPRGVVVRPRGIGDAVARIGAPGVDITGHEHIARGVGPAQDGEHVNHFRVDGDPRLRIPRDHRALQAHLKATAAGRANAFELIADKAPGGADAAGV